MSYHNLTNEEIVFLYYVSSSVVIQYDDAFADKSLTQSLTTNDSVIETIIELPQDLIDELLKSKHYLLMKEIAIKLKPIYELINDTDPEMVSRIDELFNHKQE
jgi:hypothetical protein